MKKVSCTSPSTSCMWSCWEEMVRLLSQNTQSAPQKTSAPTLTPGKKYALVVLCHTDVTSFGCVVQPICPFVLCVVFCWCYMFLTVRTTFGFITLCSLLLLLFIFSTCFLCLFRCRTSFQGMERGWGLSTSCTDWRINTWWSSSLPWSQAALSSSSRPNPAETDCLIKVYTVKFVLIVSYHQAYLIQQRLTV